MLERSPADVTVLVHAPEGLADRFDAFGGPLPEAWSEVELSLRDEQIAISPCAPDNLLGQASDLGKEIAAGPRAPETIDLNLTPLIVPSIGIADIPDVPLYRTATTARARTRATTCASRPAPGCR